MIAEYRRDFMNRYPSDMRDELSMENSFSDMTAAVGKFEAGVFEGTYQEHRTR